MANIAFSSISTSTRLPDGTSYSYVHIEPKGNKPYLLFLHGWPDSSYGWRYQIPYFSNLGYGLVVPDLLGYGGTDKPKELDAYRLKKISEDVIGILDKHGVKDVIGIGHDWGCPLLSRLANYHASRFIKFAFLDFAYFPPTGPFSLDAINEATQKALGYPIFGYWYFFNEETAGKLIDEHPEGMRSLRYGADPAFKKDNMCPLGACRSYFTERKTGPLASWPTAEEISTTEKIFAPANGGYGPTLNWYKTQIANLNTADEASLTEEQKHIRQPTLLVTCTHDAIAVPQMQVERMKPYAKDLTVKEIASGHFVQQEKAREANETLKAFIEA